MSWNQGFKRDDRSRSRGFRTIGRRVRTTLRETPASPYLEPHEIEQERETRWDVHLNQSEHSVKEIETMLDNYEEKVNQTDYQEKTIVDCIDLLFEDHQISETPIQPVEVVESILHVDRSQRQLIAENQTSDEINLVGNILRKAAKDLVATRTHKFVEKFGSEKSENKRIKKLYGSKLENDSPDKFSGSIYELKESIEFFEKYIDKGKLSKQESLRFFNRIKEMIFNQNHKVEEAYKNTISHLVEVYEKMKFKKLDLKLSDIHLDRLNVIYKRDHYDIFFKKELRKFCFINYTGNDDEYKRFKTTIPIESKFFIYEDEIYQDFLKKKKYKKSFYQYLLDEILKNGWSKIYVLHNSWKFFSNLIDERNLFHHLQMNYSVLVIGNKTKMKYYNRNKKVEMFHSNDFYYDSKGNNFSYFEIRNINLVSRVHFEFILLSKFSNLYVKSKDINLFTSLSVNSPIYQPSSLDTIIS